MAGTPTPRPRPPAVMAPSLVRSGPRFFAEVLDDPEFVRRGVLLGREPLRRVPIHWAVVDPARHEMTVWEKDRASYPAAARALDASLCTNGPFTEYAHGSLERSALAFARAAGQGALATVTRRAGEPVDWRGMPLRHFGASRPMGHVIGMAAGIREVVVDRPRLFHFGRTGPEFADYVIGRGDPDGLVEAVGGLFGGVSDYRPYTVDQHFRVGYWCIAPLDDPALADHGTDDAVRAYTEVTGRPCPGLLMVVQGLAGTQRLTHLLAAARVRDAVQIDGGDSLLLGRGARLRQGTFMPEWKRLLQRWGIQFRPRTP